MLGMGTRASKCRDNVSRRRRGWVTGDDKDELLLVLLLGVKKVNRRPSTHIENEK